MAGTGTNLAEPIPTLARTNATGAAGCRPRESRIMRDTLIKTDSPMDRLRSRRTVAMKSTATALSSAEQEELKEVLAVVHDGPVGHFVCLAPREHLAERALARAVLPHDRVDLAGVDLEIHTLENLAPAGSGDASVEVFDF